MTYKLPLSNPENQFFLIAGPCVIEDREMAFRIAQKMVQLTSKFKIPYIFKASYRKANRTKIDSFTGIGDEKALSIIQEVGKEFGILTTTDIHTDPEAIMAANYVDILQIPAFLCRQTSLLIAAAETNKIVSIKKGQFLAPESMLHAVQKVRDAGNDQIFLIDRGTMFGYQDLIVDFRGIPTMQSFGVPTVLDCTHSLQQPNQSGGVTGGRPDMIGLIAKAGIASGADGLFIETHHDTAHAKSDGANMLQLDRMEDLLSRLTKLRAAVTD